MTAKPPLQEKDLIALLGQLKQADTKYPEVLQSKRRAAFLASIAAMVQQRWNSAAPFIDPTGTPVPSKAETPTFASKATPETPDQGGVNTPETTPTKAGKHFGQTPRPSRTPKK